MAISLWRKREAPRGRYTPPLWPVWIVAPVALIAAAAVGWVTYHYAYDHFAQAAQGQTPAKPVDINDVLKATVTALTLIGAVLAGLYAYRKQLLSEGDAHRADASQLADRYTTAVEQLGHDQAAVRLGGVYALARLADDWEEQRQVCIDVLCAYLRMPYEPDPAASGHKAGEREVRLTVISIMRQHLQAPDAATSWCTYRLDFTGAVFDGGNFSESHFRGEVDFGGATFSGGAVNFGGATFSGGAVDFGGATFSGGAVNFGLATFSGGAVDFSGATFSGGTVAFGLATFSGGAVDFSVATFSGGTVNFNGATFSGGTVAFGLATFSGGTVNFNGATFSGGTANFGLATFSGGTVNFLHATLSGGAVDFGVATFSGGTVNFSVATFSGGTVDFNGATLSGATVDFHDVTLSGATVNWGPLPVPSGA